MIKNFIKYMLAVTILILVTSSCDFLDEVPDNRSNLDADENITNLLVSAYPETHYGVIAELSSDNVDDCGSKYDEYSTRFLAEAFFWESITQTDNDGLNELWESSYRAIASANEALEAIEKMGNPPRLDPQRGEAMITRAYNHFVLVNMFSQHYRKGGNDLGIPYITKPEKTVNPKYDRETVEKIYAKINDDIEAALLLIDDSVYDKKPIKYHFNQKAAYAFAARFNLFYGNYDNVIRYANLVLGSNPSNMMRDWAYLAGTSDRIIRGNRYSDAEVRSNLLLLAASSRAGLYYNEYYLGGRFTYNDGILNREINSAKGSAGAAVAGPWMQKQLMPSDAWSGTPKITVRRLAPFYEVVDAVNGIVIYKSVFPLFTTEEILLSRAEAYIMKGMYNEATNDIGVFSRAYLNNSPTATRNDINTYFKNKTTDEDLDGMKYYTAAAPTAKKRLNPPGFTIEEGEQENFIHCILLCRRMLFIHEGMRWFDIKRFGIEIERRLYNEYNGTFTILDELPKDDKRRAIQLPQDVISSGTITSNPR